MKLAACVFIVNELGQVLLTTRRNSTEVGLPGGKVDPGENFIEAAIRETKEETGISLDSSKTLRILEQVCPGDISYLTACYLTEYNGPVPGGIEEGITSRWGDPFELVTNSPFADYNMNVLTQLAETL